MLMAGPLWWLMAVLLMTGEADSIATPLPYSITTWPSCVSAWLVPAVKRHCRQSPAAGVADAEVILMGRLEVPTA